MVVRGPQDLVLPPTRGRIGILAQTDRPGALSIARRLSQAFNRHHLPTSMGIATYPAEAAEVNELIARADAALGLREEREGHARPKG
jgi:GGDEF domain-containing protein